MVTNLHPSDLEPYLHYCGYSKEQLVTDIEVVNGHRFKIPIAAFAHYPHDSRSACIAILENDSEIQSCRSLGAPLIFACHQKELLFFTQTVDGHKFQRKIFSTEVQEFFQNQKDLFSPQAVYRAKTLGRLDKSYQLSFVDLGLLPLVEEEAGQKLSDLIERVVMSTKASLHWKKGIPEGQGQWLLKSNFWLLAAKILKDKDVPAFTKLDLQDLDKVYSAVANHYGSDKLVPINTKEERSALVKSAEEISTFGHCGLVSTEALAYLYERTLITKETRVELGTHSTPTYLVDYILGKLLPWIKEIPYDQRQVFEPACGHAAFLVGAMRLLGDLSPVNTYFSEKRHQYLQNRLHGNDIDSFALEIARLSLTLANVPNPNGWDLQAEDIFKEDVLSPYLHKANIILANPPFEKFKTNRSLLNINSSYTPKYLNKAAELLWQVAKGMKPGAIFGMVLPRSILYETNSIKLRQYILKEFEIKEIIVLPDKIFPLSDAESTIILGKRLQASNEYNILYRRVRESETKEFKQTYRVRQEKFIRTSHFYEKENISFFVPDLEEIWNFCKENSKLNTIAEIGRGFNFFSEKNLPKGAITKSSTQQKGLIKGFSKFQESLQTHKLPDTFWFNLDPQVIGVRRSGTKIGVSQILLNYSPVSRGPWQLKAFLDKEGHPFTSRFTTIRPKGSSWPLEALWGICNSPLANAYSYAFATKRDILAGLVEKMPIPNVGCDALIPLVTAVNDYFRAVKENEYAQDSLNQVNQEKLKFLHWRIDEEVLQLYNLPLHLEKQLLDLFSGEQRRGVPFEQNEYFPKGYEEPLRLRELLMITADWEETNKKRTSLISKKIKKNISFEELQELETLQKLAVSRRQLIAPLPIKELEKAIETLQRKEWEKKF
jgi:hypothetical protein